MREQEDLFGQLINGRRMDIAANYMVKLNRKQRKILKYLKRSSIYFIPFTIDGNWDFADNIRVLDIENLLTALSKDTKWHYRVNICYLNYPVYMLEIYLKDNQLKQEILRPFQNFNSHYWNTEIKSNITLYLRCSDIYVMHKIRAIKRFL